MTVVVAYSADRFGRAALDHGVAEAEKRGEKLLVVNVTRGNAYVDPRFAGEHDVAELHKRIDDLPVESELRQLMSDDVADEIVGAVEAESASLVVVGIRRRTPVGKLVLGSVAQRVILEAPCPVLAVKPLED